MIFTKKKGDEWVVSTLLEHSSLRKEVLLNDGLPFVWGSMFPQIKKIDENDDFVCAYSEPIMAAALPLQDEINLSRNLLIDASRTHLNPKIVLPKNAGVSRDDLFTIGRPIYTNDVSAFSTLPLPNINSVGANLELLENEITEVTGISPQNNGANGMNNQSATEISIKAEEGGRRAEDYIRQLNESFIEPLFEKFAILVYRYGDNVLFEGFARSQMPSFRFNIQTGTGASSREVRRAGIQSSMGVFSQLCQMYMSMGDDAKCLPYHLSK